MLFLRAVLTIILLTTLAPLVTAQVEEAPGETSQASRAELASAIRQVVREIDPMAHVAVKLVQTQRKSKIKMPGTPFSLRAAAVVDRGRGQAFARADITIFSANGRLAPSVRTLVAEIGRGYADDVKIGVRPLAKEFVAARKKQEIDAAKAAEISAREWEPALAATMTRLSTVLEKADSLTANSTMPDFKKVVRYGVLAIAVLALLGLGVLYLWGSMQRQALATIQSGFRGVIAAIEAGGGGSAGYAQPAEQLQAQNARAVLPTSDAGRDWTAMPEESLLALLSDCYWTHQDRYGAFVWRRIPVPRKLGLIAQMPELSEYGAFVSQLPEEDLGMEQDPAYLSPLALYRIDMEALTEEVRKYPGLLRKLSPLRQAALRLKPLERLELHQQRAESVQVLPDLSGISSPTRTLKQALRLEVRSDDDEIEVLSLDNPTLELMEEVPSLGWLLHLPSERAALLLQQFSARDLASAWVGPQQVLERLSRLIGEKKLELMKSHMTRLNPSRSSSVFNAIHRAALKELRTQMVPSDSSRERLAS